MLDGMCMHLHNIQGGYVKTPVLAKTHWNLESKDSWILNRIDCLPFSRGMEIDVLLLNLKWVSTGQERVNSLTANGFYKHQLFLLLCCLTDLPLLGSGVNKKLLPSRFPTVGIIQKFCQAPTQLPPQNIITMVYRLPPPYGIDSMNCLNPKLGRPSEVVGRGRCRRG